MKTIDEQIKHMEDEISWYTNKVYHRNGRWDETLELCISILATLKKIKLDGTNSGDYT